MRCNAFLSIPTYLPPFLSPRLNSFSSVALKPPRISSTFHSRPRPSPRSRFLVHSPHACASSTIQSPEPSFNSTSTLTLPPIWFRAAQSALQISIAALAIVASVLCKLRFLTFLTAFLSVPSIVLSVRSFFRSFSAPPESPSAHTNQQFASPKLFRDRFDEQVDSLRAHVVAVESRAVQREQSRDEVFAQNLTSLDAAMRALKSSVEHMNQSGKDTSFAVMTELEMTKQKLKEAQTERMQLESRLQLAQLSLEENKRQREKARTEADRAMERELNLNIELQTMVTRAAKVDELMERLERVERENDTLKDRLLAQAREREEMRMSKVDAEGRAGRVEEVVRVLRERLGRLGGRKEEAEEDGDNAERENRFWEKRLRRRGSFGRGSLLYQELMGKGNKEWPENVLGEAKDGKETKSQVESLPADGGFGAFSEGEEERKESEERRLAGGKERKLIGGGEKVFSFSRDEFDDAKRNEEKSSNGNERAKSDLQIEKTGSEVQGRREVAKPTTEPEASTAVKKESEASPAVKKEPEASVVVKKEPGATPVVEKEPESSAAVKREPEASAEVTELEEGNLAGSIGDEKSMTAAEEKSGELNVSDEVTVQERSEGESEKVKGMDEKELPQVASQMQTERSGIESGGLNETSDKTEVRVKKEEAQTQGQKSDVVDSVDQTPEGLDKAVKEIGGTNGVGDVDDATQASSTQAEIDPTSTSTAPTTSTVSTTPTTTPPNESEQPTPSQTDPETLITTLSRSAKQLVRKGRTRGLPVAQASALFTKAVSHLDQALTHTDKPELQLQLANTLLSWAKIDLADSNAKERLNKALSLFSAHQGTPAMDETALFNTGLCLCLLAATCDETQAREYYQRACEVYDDLLQGDGQSRIAFFNCGLAYISLARLFVRQGEEEEVCVGYFEKAAGRFEESLRIEPGDKKASAYLQDCRREISELR